MAYFAQIDGDGVVQQVISISNTDAPDPAPAESEALGQAFIADVLGLPGDWLQTSYNRSFRGTFAGLGYRYDSDLDAFVPPQPYPSWVLDESYAWQAPIPFPSDGGRYVWDEDTLSWVEVTA